MILTDAKRLSTQHSALSTLLRPQSKGGAEAPPLTSTLTPQLLLLVLPLLRALGLKLLPLCVLVRGEHGGDLRLLRFADLLHLRAVRLHGRLQRVHLGGVVRLFGRVELLEGLAGRLEERRVLLVRRLLDVLDLRLLRVGQVQLRGELLAEDAMPAVVMA